MKQKLTKAAVAIIAAFLIIGLTVGGIAAYRHVKKELRRVADNYAAEIAGDYSRQQELTVREFKQYFGREVSQLKEYGIKAGRVENVVEVRYIVKDTTRWRDTLVYVYDTVRNVTAAPFDIKGGCWEVSGQVRGDTLEVASVSMADDITVALYREKRKCLFERTRVRAIAISRCSGDTVAVTRNLKIRRR